MLNSLINILRPISWSKDHIRETTCNPVVRDKCWDIIFSSKTEAQFTCCRRYINLALDGGHISMHIWVETNFELNKRIRALCHA